MPIALHPILYLFLGRLLIRVLIPFPACSHAGKGLSKRFHLLLCLSTRALELYSFGVS